MAMQIINQENYNVGIYARLSRDDERIGKPCLSRNKCILGGFIMKLGLFGSTHSVEMMKQFGLNDNMVMDLFDRFKPDIICGEVRREDYEQNREYQGPSEYRRFIFLYCKKRGIRFVPCNQFEDSDVEYVSRMEKIEVENEDEARRIEGGRAHHGGVHEDRHRFSFAV